MTRVVAHGPWSSTMGAVHHLATVVCEIGLGSFEILDLERDVVSAEVAVARRAFMPSLGPVVLEQLKHQIRPDTEHGNREPRVGNIDVRLGPVAAVGHARQLRRVERPEPVQLVPAEYVAVEFHCGVEVGDGEPYMIDMG